MLGPEVGLRLGVSMEMPAVAANLGDLHRCGPGSMWGQGGAGHALHSQGAQ